MLAGATVRDPARLDIRGTVQTGRDVSIDINVIATRQSQMMLKYSVIALSKTSSLARFWSIGPFARLRPDTVLAEQVHIGNFVELKKSTVAQGSKINLAVK